MKASPPALPLCVGIFLTIPFLALGDTVTLKSGETLEGNILSETDQQIVMDATVAPGITDQKTIAKGDVQAVSKTSLDEIAYQAIKGCQIESHSLPANSYAAIVKSLETFLTTYPLSSRSREVQTTLTAFKEEQEKVKAKNVKWDNRWYTPAEVEKNKYQLQAQMQLVAMREQASRRDFITALNTFDQIEKAYPGSQAFPDAIDLAKSILPQAASDMERAMNAAKIQESQFTKGIVLVPEPQKSQMIAARKGQIAAAEAAMATAEHDGVKWKPFFPLSSKSCDAIKATLATEAPRLEALPVAEMHSSIASTESAEAALKNANPALAEAKIKQAKTLWSQNERLTALSAAAEALRRGSAPAPVEPSTQDGAPSESNAPVSTTEPTPTPTPKPKVKSWYFF